MGSLDSGRTVAINENGSLAKAQRNFVIGWVILAVANIASRQSNHACRRIGVEVEKADGGGGGGLLLLILRGHGWQIVVGCVESRVTSVAEAYVVTKREPVKYCTYFGWRVDRWKHRVAYAI